MNTTSMVEINVIVLKMALVRVLLVDYGFAFRLALLASVTLYYPPTKLIQSVTTSVKCLSAFTLATYDDSSIRLRLYTSAVIVNHFC